MKSIDDIKKRAEAAASGPWKYLGTTPGRGSCFDLNGTVGFLSGDDATFAAHAREDVPALITRVHELEAGLRDIAKGDIPSFAAVDAYGEQVRDIATLCRRVREGMKMSAPEAETAELKWEEVCREPSGIWTERLDAPGGWIYRTCFWNTTTDKIEALALVFVSKSRTVAEEREACANIVQERAHYHEGRTIEADAAGRNDLASEHQARAQALRVAEAHIRARGQL